MGQPREERGAFAQTALVNRLKPVLSRRAGLALALHGEMGIGKTYTANSLLAAVTCRTYSVHATVPLAELVRLLPRPARLPRWAEGSLQALARGGHSETGSMADALAALLAALSPVVLLLEDLHEASSEMLRLWQKLAEGVRRSRGVALIVTSRIRPPEPFESYQLEPLSAAASTALLEQQLGSRLPPEATRWIYAHAAGNPLFTLEYLRFLTRQGYLWNDGERWHWRAPEREALPNTLEALIERLLASAVTSPEVRAGLEARAILPLAVAKGVWAQVAGLSAEVLAEAQRALERWGILTGGTFSHPLFGEVVLHGLGPAQRRELARRALAALAGDPLSATAFIDEAGLEPEVSLAMLKQAAQAAKDGGNQVRASRLLAQASYHARGRERGRLALEAAQGLQSVDVQESIRLARIAAEELNEVEAIHFLAGQLTVIGQGGEVEQVLARLPARERSGTLWARHLITVRGGAGDAASVVRIWREHPELHTQVEPRLAYAVGFSLVVLGQYRDADALAAQALPQAKGGLERCRLLMVRGLAHTYQRDLSLAESFLDEAVQIARAGELVSWRAAVLHNRAILREHQTRYREMLSDLEEALSLYGECGDSRRYASTQTKLARFLTEQGDYQRAEELLLECRELLSRSDPSPFLVTCECSLSDLYREWQPPHASILAFTHAERALAHALTLDLPAKLMQAKVALAKAAAWLGNPQRGLELAEEALKQARGSEDPENVMLVLPACAQAYESLGRTDAALAALAEAEALAWQLDNPLVAHRTGLELDRLQGDLTRAANRLTWFEERGLMNGVNLARRYFPALAPPAATPATAPGEALRLLVLGPLRLVRQGKVEEVRGQKRKELLAYLLEARLAGRAEVPQLELLDALYPDEPEDVATGALKQLVFQLRKSLGTGAILRTGSGYALGDLGSDAEGFLKSGDTRLWRGVYREDTQGQNQETVASALYHALYLQAADLLTKDPAEAARLGQLLLTADPYDAEALRLTMNALQACGHQRAVEQLYRQGRSQLAEVGELLPERWTSFLAAPPA